MNRAMFRCAATAAALALGAGVAVPAATAAEPAAVVAAAKANAVDRAFVRQMVPHHQMAVEMADRAEMHGRHAKIKALGEEIVSAQAGEIRRLRAIAKDLGVKPGPPEMDGPAHEVMMADADTLGLTMDEMGMMMDMEDLMGAKRFERAFIDAMVMHHQGAIRMARAELDRGQDRRLRSIARDIVSAQEREIRQLNRWRKDWYGATSPSGGVPEG